MPPNFAGSQRLLGCPELDWMVRCSESGWPVAQRDKDGKKWDHRADEVLRGCSKLRGWEKGARRGCDHPGLASSNRLYLRQGRWSPPGPHTKQGKKQPDKTGLKKSSDRNTVVLPLITSEIREGIWKELLFSFFFFSDRISKNKKKSVREWIFWKTKTNQKREACIAKDSRSYLAKQIRTFWNLI